ncbi:MAG TPA: disulfide bond formation protein B [Xanthomonadaceae bacterium]|nr:disulfide bond formation protein B [Xanthomonadaceae bacterium]
MTSTSSRFRIQFLLGALACAALMGYALYAQYVLHLEPCPLCIFQRVAVIALGVVFLLGALVGPNSSGGKRAWSLLAVLMALAGIAVAGRHLWIQSLPADQVPSCGPPLPYMLHIMSFSKMLVKVFTGSGECAQVTWRFLGLAMPGWVLICFVVLAAWAIYAGFRRKT